MYTLNSGNTAGTAGYVSSDSEREDNENTKVILSQSMHGSTNAKNEQSAIRLKEIGPRMTLELQKIEELINTGRVLYHRTSFVFFVFFLFCLFVCLFCTIICVCVCVCVFV